MLDASGRYQVWDTKLALSPKPYYAIQLCCYSEMLAALVAARCRINSGLFLGTRRRLNSELKISFTTTGGSRRASSPSNTAFPASWLAAGKPLPNADDGRWASHVEKFFKETDHLVQVAGITVGQIKKLKEAGVTEH